MKTTFRNEKALAAALDAMKKLYSNVNVEEVNNVDRWGDMIRFWAKEDPRPCEGDKSLADLRIKGSMEDGYKFGRIFKDEEEARKLAKDLGGLKVTRSSNWHGDARWVVWVKETL